MSIVSVLRLVGGLAMVAGGVVLCTPVGTEVVLVVTRQPHVAELAALPAAGAMPGPVALAAVESVPPAPAAPEPFFSAADPLLPPADGLPVRSTYVPPVPPPALAAPTPAAPVPEVDGAYHSMVDIPPPALLDAQRPPSPVAWTTASRPPVPVRPLPDVLVPATCVVRDGDDLEGIATRYYGHPSAAAAIWGANRELVPDPRVLLIGQELRLPPPWTVAPTGGDGATIGTGIEPPAGGIGIEPPGAVQPQGVTSSEAAAPWLSRSMAPAAGLAVVPVAAPAAGSARPLAVRIAPGDTLATVARRFYGDEREAERIWQANRDRLRSPALLVPGMELRLP